MSMLTVFGTGVARLATSSGEGRFLGVDWGAFVVVLLVALVATVVIVISYATGLRLLAVGGERRPAAASFAAYACFAVGVAAVLYGIWLLIPQFH
jgi:predicted cation transporter